MRSPNNKIYNDESINKISTENQIQITRTREDLILTEFKNSSQKLNNFEIKQNGDDQNSITEYESNDESIKEISTDTEGHLITEFINSTDKLDNFNIECIKDDQKSITENDESILGVDRIPK